MISIIVWCRYLSCVYSGRVPPFFSLHPSALVFVRSNKAAATYSPQPPQLIRLPRHARCLNSARAIRRIELSAVTSLKTRHGSVGPPKISCLHPSSPDASIFLFDLFDSMSPSEGVWEVVSRFNTWEYWMTRRRHGGQELLLYSIVCVILRT